VISDIAANCESLLYLNLSHCSVTDAMLRTLTTLVIFFKFIARQSQLFVYRGCSNLLYLSIAYCTTFTSWGLHYLTTGKGCQKLIYLDISGCKQVIHIIR
jgi:F-box/leucine-rich repeat protein 13